MMSVQPSASATSTAPPDRAGARERPLTYPRRGLHGEVVHTIGMQIVTGTLEPGDPFRPRTSSSRISVSRTVVREAVRVLAAKGLVRRSRRPGRASGRGRTGTSSTLTSSAGGRGGARPGRLYEETTEIRLAIEPLAARLAATRARHPEQVAGIAGLCGHGGRGRQPARIPRGGPPSSTAASSCPATTASSSTWAGSHAPCSARRSRSRRRRAARDDRRSPSCDPRRDPGARRGRRRRSPRGRCDTNGRHPPAGAPRRKPGAAEVRSLRRGGAAPSAPAPPRPRRPSAASTADPGGTVFPSKPSQWWGMSTAAPTARATRPLEGVHVADDAAGLALLVATVDRKERHLDAERFDRLQQDVGDDCRLRGTRRGSPSA